MRNKSRQSNRKRKVILVLGVLLGIGFILYPFLSQLYYDQTSASSVDDFREAVEAITPSKQQEESVRLAEAYNEALDPNLGWVDPYTDEERSEGMQTYARMLELREKIGVVNIPKINVSLPIYAGTSERVLQRGAGHLEGTSLPVGGPNTHAVITAHRGLPEARLFTDLDQMEVGDVFSVETMAGELFYEVDEILVVEPTDTDTIMIIEDKDYLTLLTCTPYMINSHRLLVRGVRTDAPPEEILDEIKDEQEKGMMYYLQTYWYYFVIILVTLSATVWIIRRQDKK